MSRPCAPPSAPIPTLRTKTSLAGPLARYTELLSRGGREQADTTPELVEKWLVRDWRQRATMGVRDRHDDRTGQVIG